jgi:hypothetical protein
VAGEVSCQQRSQSSEGDSGRLWSQNVLAIAYTAGGLVKKAVELLEAVVKAEETLAADHPSRLASQHALAIAYLADRQVQRAMELLEHVVAIRHDHPSRLVCVEALDVMRDKVAVASDETSSSASLSSLSTAGSADFVSQQCDQKRRASLYSTHSYNIIFTLQEPKWVELVLRNQYAFS